MSEDDLDSAHSLKRLCSGGGSLTVQPPQLMLHLSQGMAAGASPRLVGSGEEPLLSLHKTASGGSAGSSSADLTMWSGLPEVSE